MYNKSYHIIIILYALEFIFIYGTQLLTQEKFLDGDPVIFIRTMQILHQQLF